MVNDPRIPLRFIRATLLVIGQSNGGMVTLGYGAVDPRAKAIINFAGGINTPNKPSCDWRNEMIRAASELGATTRIPSLWIYADDDELFPPAISQPFFDAYRQGAASAMLKTYPKGGHNFMNTRHGRKTWGPDMEVFLSSVGMPAKEIH